jgi:hypothetical protein
MSSGQPSLDAPFVGGPRAGVWFELASTDDDPPFVVLDDSGRFSRVLHGRVRMGASDTLLDVAVKMQRDAYQFGGAEYATLTNAAIDEMWRCERADQRRTPSACVAAALALTGSGESGPVLYCRERKVYFHPPCPRTGVALRVCREDGVLQDCGLRPYGSSMHRYLWSGTGDNRAAAPQVFYKRTALDDERPRSDVKVRTGAELFTDLAPLAHGEVDAKIDFPCRQCGERDNCYPRAGKTAPLAPRRLVPLSYYDFAFLAMPALPLGYSELCELLAGAPWSEVKQRALALGGRGRAELLATLDARLDGGRQWLHRRDHRTAMALEVLRAKLTAFAQVVDGVAAVHRACARPHLGVEPRNVMATLVDAGPGVPVRWAARVQLIDLGAARRLLPAHPSRRDVPLRFVADGSPAYRDPASRSADGVATFAQVRVERVVATPADKRVNLRALFAPDARLGEYRPGDLVRVMLTADIWVWTEVVAVEGSALALTAEHASPEAERLLIEQREFHAHVWLYKSLGPPCDLYGLGLLLFRTLLTNDEQSAARIEEIVTRCAQKLASDSEDKVFTPQRCRDYLDSRMREQQRVFHATALLWQRAERAGEIAGFPEDLWSDLRMFGFRLMTKIKDFSFASSHADEDPHQPGAVAARVAGELAQLLWRTHSELFERQRRDHDLHHLCRNMLEEVREALLGDDTAPGERGVPA